MSVHEYLRGLSLVHLRPPLATFLTVPQLGRLASILQRFKAWRMQGIYANSESRTPKGAGVPHRKIQRGPGLESP